MSRLPVTAAALLFVVLSDDDGTVCREVTGSRGTSMDRAIQLPLLLEITINPVGESLADTALVILI